MYIYLTVFDYGSESLISNSNVLSKVYVPRMIVHAGDIFKSFIDFIIMGLAGRGF